jgi:hypothetical protein
MPDPLHRMRAIACDANLDAVCSRAWIQLSVTDVTEKKRILERRTWIVREVPHCDEERSGPTFTFGMALKKNTPLDIKRWNVFGAPEEGVDN